MRATVIVVIVSLLVPVVVVAQAVSSPPKPLRMVGDHWTPYEPPAELPEGVTIHFIEPGDTLWDLAARFLNDPYLWPQIWERNPYILDSHWIYPGDPLVIGLQVEEQPGEAPMIDGETGEMIVGDEVLPADYPVEELPAAEEEEFEEGVPQPLGSAADVYCFAILAEDDNIFPYAIRSAERIGQQDHYATRDIVYMDGGSLDGIAAGDRFEAYHRIRPLRHPVSGAELGVVYHKVGQIKVLCAQETTAIAEVTLACDGISLNDSLLPFQPIPVPLVIMLPPNQTCDPSSNKMTGYITYIHDDAIDAGTHQLVMIDVGAADGLYPGQFALVFRDNPTAGMPRLVIGEIGLLTVEDTYSTAKIIRSWSFIKAGDRVEIR